MPQYFLENNKIKKRKIVMAFNVSALPEYIEQRRLPLIAEAVLKAKSADLFNVQTDIKTSAAINLVNATPVFQEGGCGWNAAGDVALSQRVIETGLVKINMAFCDKDLLGTWAGYEVKAGLSDEKLPFEEYFTNNIIKKVQAGIEAAIWKGDKASEDATLNKMDGLVKILGAAEGTIKPTVAEGASAYERIKAAYLAIPEQVLDRAVVLVGADTFRTYMQEMVEKNFYHYAANGMPAEEFVIPGTNTRVIAVNGLNGTGAIVAGDLNNFFYGCDMVNDREILDVWYSKDFRETRLAMEFNFGVQVAFPSEVVYLA